MWGLILYFKMNYLLVLIIIFVNLKTFSKTTKEYEDEFKGMTQRQIFGQAIKLFNKEKFEESLIHWRYLVINNTNNSLYYFNYANTHYELENYKAAIHGYKRVVLLRSNLTPAALLYLAKSYANRKKTEEAVVTIKKLLSLNIPPGIKSEAQKLFAKLDDEERKRQQRTRQKKMKAPIDFPLGLSFFKQQNYLKAIYHLNLASQSYEEAELFLIRGICHFKLKNKEKAKEDFNKVIKIAKEPDIRRNANSLLALIQKQAESKIIEKKYWNFGIDLSLNFEDNVFTLNNIDNDAKDSNFGFYLELGRKVYESEIITVNPNLELVLEESISGKSDRFLEYSFLLPIYYYHGKDSLFFIPRYTEQEIDNIPYITKVGGRFNFTRSILKNSRVGVEYQSMKNGSQSSDTNYLNGTSSYIKFIFGNRGDRFDFSLGLNFIDDQFDDEPSNVVSNEGIGINLLLLVYPIENVSLSTSLNFLNKDYSPDPSTEFERTDKNISISFGFSYTFKNKINVYVNSNLSYIDSNLADGIDPQNISASDEIFDFDEAVSLGLSWYY